MLAWLLAASLALRAAEVAGLRSSVGGAGPFGPGAAAGSQAKGPAEAATAQEAAAAREQTPQRSVPAPAPPQLSIRAPPPPVPVHKKVGCAADVRLDAKQESRRIPATKYRLVDVPVLTETFPDGRSTTYSIRCQTKFKIPMTVLLVEKRCDGGPCALHGRPWYKKQKRGFWFDRTLVPLSVKQVVRDVSFDDALFLGRIRNADSATRIKLSLINSRTCDGQKRMKGCLPGCCPEGTSCEVKIGKCLPRLFSVEGVCKDAYSSHCASILRSYSRVEEWAFMVTARGGGGHIAAARNLASQWKEAWWQRFHSLRALLDSEKDMFTPAAYHAMSASLSLSEERGPPIEVVDIMSTPCFKLFGMSWGDWSRQQWDNAQLVGDLEKQKRLIRQQWMVPYVFGKQCTKFMKKVLRGEVFDHRSTPHEVISTQPLLLQSIAKALRKVNKRMQRESFEHQGNETNRILLDLHMTDLPTPAAVHFFEHLANLVWWSEKDSMNILLHTVAPAGVEDPAGAVAELSKLQADQIVIEPFMPVGADFVRPGGLPRPGESTEIALKAQTDGEARFLSGLTGTAVGEGEEAALHVKAEDRVMLVMLGSQPTLQAMEQYLAHAMALPASVGLNWIFLACGKPSIDSYAELYARSAERAAVFNAGGGAERRLFLVPFTGQPAQQMLGRADVTLTRSGGLTSGELLALAHRGDGKTVLLHVEVPEGSEPLPPPHSVREVPEVPEEQMLEGGREEVAEERRAWEEQILEGGMVPWEAGNARHLMAALGAKIVTPKMPFEDALQQ